MVELRAPVGQGVRRVRCLSGPAVWDAFARGDPSPDPLRTLIEVRRSASPGRPVPEPKPGPNDALFRLEYADGFRADVAMLDSLGTCFGFVGRVGTGAPRATVFALEDRRPFGHFGHLLRAIESMVLTGRPAYPVERTLLTTGVLDALLQSRLQGGAWVPTPHLSEHPYTPSDWPFAPGASGTPA
jgi:hypothetical protein